MGTPEIIRQIADSRRQARERVQQKKLLQQMTPEEIAQEEARKQGEQTEVNEMFRKMRTDCEGLLDTRGVVKKRGLLQIKYKMLEISIPDEGGENVRIALFSLKREPASSDVILVAGEVFGGLIAHTESEYVKFERDNSYVVRLVPEIIPHGGVIMEERKRKPTLQDARKWNEVVDVLREQRQ